MIPVVSIVGKKNSGKTRLLQGLVCELKKRNWSVCVIKHCDCEIKPEDIDREGKDSYKHREVGADIVALSSKNIFAFFNYLNCPKTIDEIKRYLPSSDIILTEGFKGDKKPKIEVVSTSPICCEGDNLVAIVSNKNIGVSNVPQFLQDDYAKIANFLEEGFIKREKGGVSFFVDDKEIFLNKFTARFLKNTIFGMISSLHDIPDKPKKIRIDVNQA